MSRRLVLAVTEIPLAVLLTAVTAWRRRAVAASATTQIMKGTTRDH